MAVIFAVVGGGAVLGIATSPDYGDYGDQVAAAAEALGLEVMRA